MGMFVVFVVINSDRIKRFSIIDNQACVKQGKNKAKAVAYNDHQKKHPFSEEDKDDSDDEDDSSDDDVDDDNKIHA
jgi:hypothetical protein